MRRTYSNVIWKEALPRLTADMVMVHLAALASLAAVVMWQSAGGGGVRTTQLVRELRGFYLHSFLPLSAIFPIVFLRAVSTRVRGATLRITSGRCWREGSHWGR